MLNAKLKVKIASSVKPGNGLGGSNGENLPDRMLIF
jgi:hypothetical protein